MRRLWLLAVCVLAGCATKPIKSSLPMPPQVTSEEAKARFKKSQELNPFKARESYTFTWEDCGPQPPGTVYRVLRRPSLAADWTLHDTTVKHSYTVPTNERMMFYTVVPLNGVAKAKALKECE